SYRTMLLLSILLHPACVLPAPRRSFCGNYARVVNQILQGLTNMHLWIRLPLENSKPMDDDLDKIKNNSHTLQSEIIDSWELWNSFRLLCDHSSQLCVVLDILSTLPSINSLARWFGEPVRAAILQTEAFLTNAKGYPCLSKRHHSLLTGFFKHSIQVIISGRSNHNVFFHRVFTYSADNLTPLSFFPSKLPLMDNLEVQTYEIFEKDVVKYTQYRRAVAKALVDRVADDAVSTTRTVLMVVGAGRGPLAAEETGRKLKVYDVEKNPNAVITLHVSRELIGSFGDNELSPECLDGAQRFLKPDGISIPSSYCLLLVLHDEIHSHAQLSSLAAPQLNGLFTKTYFCPNLGKIEKDTKNGNQRVLIFLYRENHSHFRPQFLRQTYVSHDITLGKVPKPVPRSLFFAECYDPDTRQSTSLPS
ncbi:hypothetical protein ACJX0J_012449, partial [Zea mays]